jgi:hypothetical protein
MFQRKDVIEVGQQFYIRAQSLLADARILSLVCNDTLGIFDRHGDIALGRSSPWARRRRSSSRRSRASCADPLIRKLHDLPPNCFDSQIGTFLAPSGLVAGRYRRQAETGMAEGSRSRTYQEASGAPSWV